MHRCSMHQSLVLNGFNMMMQAIRSVPRVETKLYPVEVGIIGGQFEAYCCYIMWRWLIRAAKTREASHQSLPKRSSMRQKKR